MGFKLGVILFPLFILSLILKDRGPVSKFIKAKATSPETARRLDSMGVKGPYWVSGAIRRGVLVGLEDGRYYVDVGRNRRRRRWALAVIAAAAVVMAAGVLLLWPDTE